MFMPSTKFPLRVLVKSQDNLLSEDLGSIPTWTLLIQELITLSGTGVQSMDNSLPVFMVWAWGGAGQAGCV
jgi:hypothetical protein